MERRPIAAREADATHSLFERHSRRIYNYCLHQLRSREEAEDAVQTTFMNAFRGLKRGIVPEAEQAWLFKIAENVCLSRRRSSWRRGRVETPNDFEVLQEIVPSRRTGADELIGLEDALEAMPENQRRAILLREWQGLSYREIADELDISQAAVETLIFRARRTLAQGLEEPPAPKRARSAGRGLNGINAGTLFASLKSLLTGGSAVKALAVAVAAGTATVVATEAPRVRHHATPPPAKRSTRQATPHRSPGSLAAVRSAATSTRSDQATRTASGAAERVRAARVVKAVAPSPATAAPAEPQPDATAAVEPAHEDSPAAATPAAPQPKAEQPQAPSTGSRSPSNAGAKDRGEGQGKAKGKERDDSGKGEKKKDRVASQTQTPPPVPAAAALAPPPPTPGDPAQPSPPQASPVPAPPAAGAEEHGKGDGDHERKERARDK